MPQIAIFDWSQYTLPGAIPYSDIENDTHSNDPAHPDHDGSQPTWIGEPFTFNGGAATPISINDDDEQFDDGYVDSGSAQTLAQDVTINGTTYLAGAMVENEFSMLDAGGHEVFVVRIDGANVGFGYPVGQEPANGSTFTATQGRDGAAEDSGDGISSSSEPYSNIVCYALGTLIRTPNGQVPVETLMAGDLVTTMDHGPQAIVWTRKDTQTLDICEKSDKPVLIAAGALGRGTPETDLVVSPHHRIFVGGHEQLLEDFPTEGFAPAKSLTVLPRIRHMNGKAKITWVHFACLRHEIVTANGCLSESLLLGPMVINGFDIGERQALADAFESTVHGNAALNGPPAREIFSVGKVRKILARHARYKTARMENEFRKWDVDAAMERYEIARLKAAILLRNSYMKSLAA